MGFGKRLITAGLLLGAGTAVGQGESLVQRLISDHTAMVAAEKDFHAQRQRGALIGNEASEYAEFVARLHRKVAEGCVALRNAGLAAPPDVECPVLTPHVLAPAAIDQANEETPDEAVAALDAELFAGLGQFDEMLLREQERVRAEAPMPSTAGGAGTGGEAGGAGASDRAIADASGASAAREEADPGAGPGTPRPQERTERTPADIPDGSDDDVVARQLREAAEKENDPELKRKLWEEYRRYKEGLR